MDLEQHNYRQMEQLNQRGGRMLSIVDLLQANTLWGRDVADYLSLVEGQRRDLPGRRPCSAYNLHLSLGYGWQPGRSRHRIGVHHED